MMKSAAFPIVATALLAMALSGCATQVTPVEVTRFHLPEINVTQRGAIAVEAPPGDGAKGLEFSAYANAVAAELAKLGYTRQTGAAMIAEVDVQRHGYREDRSSGPVSVGVGGSTGGWGSGVGVGLGFNLSGRPREQIETQLAVTIRERATGRSIWEGRARSAVRTDSTLANSQVAAARMAEALFRNFPGKSGETVLVP